MPSTLQASIAVALAAKMVETGGIGHADHDINFTPSNVFTHGVAADQANQLYAASRTLAASATENLDMSGGLVNALGVSITFTKVKAILIRSKSTNTNDVVVGGAAANGFWSGLFGALAETIRVKPGGIFLITAPALAGIPVTAATADLLKITNGAAGTPVDYDVVIIGVA